MAVGNYLAYFRCRVCVCKIMCMCVCSMCLFLHVCIVCVCVCTMHILVQRWNKEVGIAVYHQHCKVGSSTFSQAHGWVVVGRYYCTIKAKVYSQHPPPDRCSHSNLCSFPDTGISLIRNSWSNRSSLCNTISC